MSLHFKFKFFVLTLLFFGQAHLLHAQKKIDQIIPDAEKRRVLKAKKLFNDFKIYEGQRVLLDLIREHPYVAYYHEALVQLQRQVLYQIRPAQYQLESFKTSLPSDSTIDEEADELAKHESKTQNQASTKKDTIAIEWNGLDTGPRKEDKIKGRKKLEDEREAEQEASVTIDSSLIRKEIAYDENGTEVKETTIAERRQKKAIERQIKELSDLAQIPYDGYKQDLIQNCRKSTLQIEFADSASAYLREFLVDTLDPDIRVSEAAKEAYESGVDELNAHEALSAKKYFEQAIALHADYYSAHLALGDAYYLIGKDSGVIHEYRKASLLQTKRPEPLEKLSLFYYQRGKYEEAAAACIEAISIYPQQHYFQLLKRIVNKTGKDFATQWIQREVYPLSTSKNYFEITALEKTPWWQYQSIESDVHGYVDTNGIFRPNDKTTERYIELYAWKHMLDDTKQDIFPFARAMRKMGYLDCYVLITCFHHDLYGQFADFAKHNKEKIKDYFYIVINWQDKRFDKIRKEFEPKKEEKKVDVKAAKKKDNNTDNKK